MSQSSRGVGEQSGQRIGPVVPGGALPKGLRQQRWSLMNVPLMSAASRAPKVGGQGFTDPTLRLISWRRVFLPVKV